MKVAERCGFARHPLRERLHVDFGKGGTQLDSSDDATPTIQSSVGHEKFTLELSRTGDADVIPSHAYGTVDDCIRHVERLLDAGTGEILFLSQIGTVARAAMFETMPRFRG